MELQREILRLPIEVFDRLCDILDYEKRWKTLIRLIPDKISQDDFKCDITCDNLAKYNSFHIGILEYEYKRCKRSCSQNLFYEWCREEPNVRLGHLIYLLNKARLFTVTGYLAEVMTEDLIDNPWYGLEPIILPTCSILLGLLFLTVGSLLPSGSNGECLNSDWLFGFPVFEKYLWF
ncbi:hypothetical protein ABEB36_000437 [Hypothenemus hampei]|uniref:Tube Death domain-containing protein n=1 Tax=Hypothenemus hampei TaxID=57062 RepID=A0ABD1FBX7_HYPHA